LGARVVKTYWCEDFEKVVRGCPVPVVMAGGPQVDSELEVFEFVYDGIQKGAIGVNLGRNIWQNDFPVAMIRAIRAIIHENASPKEAQELYDSITTVVSSESLWTSCLDELHRSGFQLGPITKYGKISVSDKSGHVMSIFRKERFPFSIWLKGTAGRIRIYSAKDWDDFVQHRLAPMRS